MAKIRIEIEQELFRDLLLLCADNPENPTLAEFKQVLEVKLNRIINRDLYNRSRTASTPEERERARQEYLDRRNIPKDFRW